MNNSGAVAWTPANIGSMAPQTSLSMNRQSAGVFDPIAEKQLQLARLQQKIQEQEQRASMLRTKISKTDEMKVHEKAAIATREQRKFEDFKASKIRELSSVCARVREKVVKFLDDSPLQAVQEFAGRYEVRSVETHLEELYPPAFIETYTCVDPLEFESEGKAYAAYVQAERGAHALRSGSSFSGSMFTGITKLLSLACETTGGAGKVVLIVIALLTLSFIFAPFLLLGIYAVLAIASAVQGAVAAKVFDKLFSVKSYLNEAYDEDIFRENREEVLNAVDNFLDSKQSEYTAKVNKLHFSLDQSLLKQIDLQAEESKKKMLAEVAQIDAELNTARSTLERLAQELNEAQIKLEKEAETIHERVYNTIDWKYEWYGKILTDITAEHRQIQTPWTQGNTLYISSASEKLQTFGLLAAFQTAIHMHPTFSNQVVLDYKDNGGKMIPFKKLPTVILEMCTTAETIAKRMERLTTDTQARCDNILQSCANIAEFNQLMSKYGSNGESYCVIHIYGLKAFSEEMRTLLRNGPKVGIFYKLYMTVEEYTAVAKDFPFDTITEIAEVTDTVTPRTRAHLERYK